MVATPAGIINPRTPKSRKVKGDGAPVSPNAPRTFSEPKAVKAGASCVKCRNLAIGAKGGASCKAGGPLEPCAQFDDASKPRWQGVLRPT